MSSPLSPPPALLGGSPVFTERVEIVSPLLPSLEQIEAPLREILRTGNLTNNSTYVRQFERALSQRLGSPFATAISNGTMGLLLAVAGLKLEGEVILPSFTFSATAHILGWNRLTLRFCDILPDTFTLDPAAVEAAITPSTSAILAVHIYGHPCEIEELTAVARRHSLALIFDAAHAFGSNYRGAPIGAFGDAEVFSFHATKIFPVGEGACVTTKKADLAEYIHIARVFGSVDNDNTKIPGLNAKMQEFNAIIGLNILNNIDQIIDSRRQYAQYLIHRLGELPGISFQSIRPDVATNYQNFVILVDPVQFGLTRDSLHTALMAENVRCRKYFHPPLHKHDTYSLYRSVHLPVTEQVSNRVLCLPFYSHMSKSLLDGICTAVERIHLHAESIRQLLE